MESSGLQPPPPHPCSDTYCAWELLLFTMFRSHICIECLCLLGGGGCTHHSHFPIVGGGDWKWTITPLSCLHISVNIWPGIGGVCDIDRMFSVANSLLYTWEGVWGGSYISVIFICLEIISRIWGGGDILCSIGDIRAGGWGGEFCTPSMWRECDHAFRANSVQNLARPCYNRVQTRFFPSFSYTLDDKGIDRCVHSLCMCVCGGGIAPHILCFTGHPLNDVGTPISPHVHKST